MGTELLAFMRVHVLCLKVSKLFPDHRSSNLGINDSLRKGANSGKWLGHCDSQEDRLGPVGWARNMMLTLADRSVSNLLPAILPAIDKSRIINHQS